MYFWISNAPITAVFFILRQFVVFIKVYLYLSHEATDAKKTLTYERGREIASDRNANDHNYLCVYSENCSEEFCSSVVKRWSDKHNNDASANNHGENQVTEVKYNLISATFPLKYITDIRLWTTALTKCCGTEKPGVIKIWCDFMWNRREKTGNRRESFLGITVHFPFHGM